MSEKEKPREFWLSETGTIKDVIFYSVYRNKEDTLNPYGKGLQVIEKSAYTALLSQTMRLREALEFYADPEKYQRTVEDKLGYNANPEEWIYSEPEILEDRGFTASIALLPNALCEGEAK